MCLHAASAASGVDGECVCVGIGERVCGDRGAEEIECSDDA